MKYLKIFGLVVLCSLVFSFLVFKDYEFERDPAWPSNVKVYSNMVTNRIRVVDSDDGTTLFYYPVDGFARPASLEKRNDQWIVTFVKK